jgi:hypothetical protein
MYLVDRELPTLALSKIKSYQNFKTLKFIVHTKEQGLRPSGQKLA